MAKAKKATTKKVTKKTVQVIETPPVSSRSKEEIQKEIDALNKLLSDEVSQAVIRDLNADIAALEDEIGKVQ